MEYRWNIFLVNLDPVIGSEQGKTRPVLVISEEAMNQILPVVNVLPITSLKPHRHIYPNEVGISPENSGLLKDSLILCYQIRVIDKQRLIKPLGKINDIKLQDEIIEALCFQLAIPFSKILKYR